MLFRLAVAGTSLVGLEAYVRAQEDESLDVRTVKVEDTHLDHYATLPGGLGRLVEERILSMCYDGAMLNDNDENARAEYADVDSSGPFFVDSQDLYSPGLGMVSVKDGSKKSCVVYLFEKPKKKAKSGTSVNPSKDSQWLDILENTFSSDGFRIKNSPYIPCEPYNDVYHALINYEMRTLPEEFGDSLPDGIVYPKNLTKKTRSQIKECVIDSVDKGMKQYRGHLRVQTVGPKILPRDQYSIGTILRSKELFAFLFEDDNKNGSRDPGEKLLYAIQDDDVIQDSNSRGIVFTPLVNFVVQNEGEERTGRCNIIFEEEEKLEEESFWDGMSPSRFSVAITPLFVNIPSGGGSAFAGKYFAENGMFLEFDIVGLNDVEDSRLEVVPSTEEDEVEVVNKESYMRYGPKFELGIGREFWKYAASKFIVGAKRYSLDSEKDPNQLILDDYWSWMAGGGARVNLLDDHLVVGFNYYYERGIGDVAGTIISESVNENFRLDQISSHNFSLAGSYISDYGLYGGMFAYGEGKGVLPVGRILPCGGPFGRASFGGSIGWYFHRSTVSWGIDLVAKVESGRVDRFIEYDYRPGLQLRVFVGGMSNPGQADLLSPLY